LKSARLLPSLEGALCLTILLLAFSSAYNSPGEGIDEGVVLVCPELIQHGAVPYRDFESVYGPANWWFLSGVYAVFGTNIHVERTVGLLYRLLCLTAIFTLTHRRSLPVVAACTLLAGSLLIKTGIEALSWWGAMACALGSIALPAVDTSPGSRLASDLAQADWLVLNRAWDEWREHNRSRENGPDEPLRAVGNTFTLLEEYGPYGLLCRKGKVIPE
jgi:hypothetical protein